MREKRKKEKKPINGSAKNGHDCTEEVERGDRVLENDDWKKEGGEMEKERGERRGDKRIKIKKENKTKNKNKNKNKSQEYLKLKSSTHTSHYHK